MIYFLLQNVNYFGVHRTEIERFLIADHFVVKFIKFLNVDVVNVVIVFFKKETNFLLLTKKIKIQKNFKTKKKQKRVFIANLLWKSIHTM